MTLPRSLPQSRVIVGNAQLAIFDCVYDNQNPSMQAKTQIQYPIKEEPSPYRPLPSVWDGDDSELLERLLAFYPRREPKRILDATVNGGRFWKGSTRQVVGMDIAHRHRPLLVGDNTQMPFADGVFDVVVYEIGRAH